MWCSSGKWCMCVITASILSIVLSLCCRFLCVCDYSCVQVFAIPHRTSMQQSNVIGSVCRYNYVCATKAPLYNSDEKSFHNFDSHFKPAKVYSEEFKGQFAILVAPPLISIAWGNVRSLVCSWQLVMQDCEFSPG